MKCSAAWEEQKKWFAFQNYDVIPDIIATAKALGGGVPVGAFVAGEKCAIH